jgi:MFS family permease
VPLIAIGGLATAVFLCGAVAQVVMGRLVERYPPNMLFVGIVAMQLAGIVWAANTSGMLLIAALAVTMAAIYGQVTVGDIVIARYTADAWRGRIYAVRYFLTFVSAGAAVSIIAFLHGRGGFDSVLAAVAFVAAVFLAATIAFVILVSGVRAGRSAAQPAE